jgi:NADPH:quinone reductase-like Zn-dependent oxidoreductase
MKEALIFPGPKVKIVDVDFPSLPSPNHLIIKVMVSGSNPKDWAIAERGQPFETINGAASPVLTYSNQFPESTKATMLRA